MKFLAKGTTDRIIEGQDVKLESLLRTFRHNLQNKYNRYTFFFFLCEVFNFLIMAFQFYVTGWSTGQTELDLRMHITGSQKTWLF